MNLGHSEQIRCWDAEVARKDSREKPEKAATKGGYILASRFTDEPRPKYLEFPIDIDWCKAVQRELNTRGRGSREALRKFIADKLRHGVTSSQVSDVITGKQRTSDLVEPIHEFLDWKKPLSPLASRDVAEAKYLTERLTPEQRELFFGVVEIIADGGSEHAHKIIEELVKMRSGE